MGVNQNSSQNLGYVPKSTRRKQLQSSAAGGEKQTLLSTDAEDQSVERKM
jgi:hypothetical protein